MKYVFLGFIIFCHFLSNAGEDWTWWNEKHGWKPGMPSWRSFVHITPGFLGPNALPVPEVKKGIIPEGTNLEISLDYHYLKGDPTQNLFVKYYKSFAENKIAIELFGVVAEHYSMSENIRDKRVARDFDGKGIANGDMYFSTLIQLVKDKKFPDLMVRLAGRTASGSQLEAARYSDSPGYYFDFSSSRELISKNGKTSFIPYASFGFYSWQTNDDLNLQNDAFMYGAGAEIKFKSYSINNSISGYSGYKKERDKPMVFTFDFNRKLRYNSIRFQYLIGIRDWKYQTLKFSYIIDLKSK